MAGVYTLGADDLGRAVSADPASAVLNLPPLSNWPTGKPFTILVSNAGTAATVPLNAHGAEIIEDFLNDGTGVPTRHLVQGTRLVVISSGTSWVYVLLSVPQVPVAGFLPGNLMLDAAPVAVKPGFLICNGAEVLRATYPDLFAAIGITWGAGDGTTTFNLPNGIDDLPRVYNGGGSHDYGRVFGTYQEDEFQGHTFGISGTDRLLDSGGTDNGSATITVAGVNKTEVQNSCCQYRTCGDYERWY